jgi:hypothetical protein
MKNYLFGYGTLISKSSRNKSGLTGEWFIVNVKGFKRI